MKEKKDKEKRVSSERGFTLLEVILVLAMVTISFLAAYGLFIGAVKSDAESRNEIIATNLAQEAVEIVRNARDSNISLGDSMNIMLLPGICYPFDHESGPRCDGGLGASRKIEVGIESVGGETIYANCPVGAGCAVGGETSFERWCELNYPTGDGTKEIEATCKVRWESLIGSGVDREVEATVLLTDWLE